MCTCGFVRCACVHWCIGALVHLWLCILHLAVSICRLAFDIWHLRICAFDIWHLAFMPSVIRVGIELVFMSLCIPADPPAEERGKCHTSRHKHHDGPSDAPVEGVLWRTLKTTRRLLSELIFNSNHTSPTRTTDQHNTAIRRIHREQKISNCLVRFCACFCPNRSQFRHKGRCQYQWQCQWQWQWHLPHR